MTRPTRRALLAGLAAGTAGLAGCTGGTGSGGGGGGADCRTADGDLAWQTETLTDVRTDETFALNSFDRPVLLETFAVWCSTCLRQQQEMRTLHERVGDDVVSVTLNIDPNEDAAKVRSHLEDHGFDWRYAISPSAVTRSLVDTFDQSITVPPKAPVVFLFPDGRFRRMPDGVKSADTLETAIDEGC